MMGLLDLPSPLLAGIDDWLTGFLPPLAKLVVWAAIGALLSMEFYRRLSPQRRISQVKLALDRARRHVMAFDGEVEDAWPHIRRMLSLAMRRVLMVLPATLGASLPLLVFLVWLDTSYGGTFPPPGAPVSVLVPGDFQGRWVDAAGSVPPRAEVLDSRGARIADVPIEAPVPVIHKRRWWNALIGNPAGYLPDELPVDRVEITLPRQQFLSIGPGWARGWEVTFFAALVLFASLFKALRRIE